MKFYPLHWNILTCTLIWLFKLRTPIPLVRSLLHKCIIVTNLFTKNIFFLWCGMNMYLNNTRHLPGNYEWCHCFILWSNGFFFSRHYYARLPKPHLEVIPNTFSWGASVPVGCIFRDGCILSFLLWVLEHPQTKTSSNSQAFLHFSRPDISVPS